jgi:hypothetical protein
MWGNQHPFAGQGIVSPVWSLIHIQAFPHFDVLCMEISFSAEKAAIIIYANVTANVCINIIRG